VFGVGVVGYGYWGPNLVRNFSDLAGCEVASVCDLRPERRELVARRHPSVTVTDDAERLISDPRIDAVVIATPVSTHFDLAMRALTAGKHVWVEKPLALDSGQAQRLVEQAERVGRTLHVDHTFAYTPAVRKIRDLVTEDALGRLYYYDSVRVNLGLFQHDVDVMWDLAVHDLSIIDYVLPEKPIAVSATGMAHVPGEPENIAYITLFFPSSLIAHVHVNWLAPVKVRRTLLGGDRRMVVYDDLEPSEKIKIYDKGITTNPGIDDVYKLKVGYRSGDMFAPRLDVTEALLVEGQHFMECISRGEPTLTDGRAGLRVVQILEAASRSMRERGRVIELEAARCAA
jgi:predicted dehydrogenase